MKFHWKRTLSINKAIKFYQGPNFQTTCCRWSRAFPCAHVCTLKERRLAHLLSESWICVCKEGSRGLCFQALMCDQQPTGLPFTSRPILPAFCPPILTQQGEGFQRSLHQKLKEKKLLFRALMCGNRMRGRAQIRSPGNRGWYAAGISLKLETKQSLWISKPNQHGFKEREREGNAEERMTHHTWITVGLVCWGLVWFYQMTYFHNISLRVNIRCEQEERNPVKRQRATPRSRLMVKYGNCHGCSWPSITRLISCRFQAYQILVGTIRCLCELWVTASPQAGPGLLPCFVLSLKWGKHLWLEWCHWESLENLAF